MKIIELTKENEEQYIDQIIELEKNAIDAMKREGREGQLFATGKQGISEYIHSEQNTVLVSINEEGQVEATTYITQGQEPFTYNDITKYFKYGESYKQYVRMQYSSEEQYKQSMLKIYTIKIKAFEYASRQILEEFPEVRDIQSFLEKEVQENGFHEKSELREKLNKYMSAYISKKFGLDILRQYEQFYWITASDIFSETGKKCNVNVEGVSEYETFLKYGANYDTVLQQQRLIIHEKPDFEEIKYYSANTENSIELDTYITSPNNRQAGIARILIYEGIKKHIESHFRNPQNKEVFLCSTLHRDNLPSRYVSEFFGLTDSLYVNRRQGRNREVHICRISREEAMEYLTSISDKLAVLYDYNPNQKSISEHVKKKVLEEQLNYERTEHKRLAKAHATEKKFSGFNIKFIEGKARKIKRLLQQIEQIEKSNKGEH